MWLICGDLNTALANHQYWKRNYEKYRDQIRVHQALTGNNNNPGDYMRSQGFFARHVQSTIGCSDPYRKHASDANDMVTL